MNSPQHTSPSHADPFKWSAIGLCCILLLTLPVLLGIVVSSTNKEQAPEMGYFAVTLAERQSRPVGLDVYQSTCMVCHGPDGEGAVNLGKPLRNSGYVQDSDDQTLFDMIANGRMPNDPANTTGIVMPARGAQGITDEQIHDVMVHLRSMQDPAQPRANLDAWIVEKPEAPEGAADIVGRDFFVAMCSACHGANGEGMEGLGKPFTTSKFIKDSTDKEIIMLVKMGRPIWDAANTTGVDMPPKGGNPAMSDDQLNDIISYIRSISTID